MATKINKNAFFIIGVASVMLLTSACMPSKIQKKIEITDETNESLKTENPIKEDIENTEPYDVDLDVEQKEILDKLDETSPESALSENKLDVKDEVDLFVPIKRTVYKDEREFSQYISNLFYLYHTKQIEAEVFYNDLSPHFHENFKALLPETEQNQIRTFEVLQEQFLIHLPSPIVSYKITNLEIDPRTKESSFYRMYELENGIKVYYGTIIQPVEGQWLLVDDSPAPPYKITSEIEETLHEVEEDSTQ